MTGRKPLTSVRKSKADLEGDGDTAEGIAAEVAHLHERLLAAIQPCVKDVAGKPNGHDGHAHPCFLNDLDGGGAIGKDEAKMPNKYASLTPRLLRTACIHQFVARKPGPYARNTPYVLQLVPGGANAQGRAGLHSWPRRG